MELRERVCSNYFTCCFHLFEKQPVTKFPCTSFTGPHNSVLFGGRTWASIVKALTKRCWSIPRREAWAKGKGRYTFNTGGYCPIELSCPHQSSFLRLDFFLVPLCHLQLSSEKIHSSAVVFGNRISSTWQREMSCFSSTVIPGGIAVILDAKISVSISLINFSRAVSHTSSTTMSACPRDVPS